MEKEEKSAIVTEKAKQAEDIRCRWLWVELSTWTSRMLTALEEGVKGGKWFSLIDKVQKGKNLIAAYNKVKSNAGSAGVDNVTVKGYAKHLDDNLARVGKELKDGTYEPRDIKRIYIPKPGTKEKRPLGIPTVRDRVVQTALRNVIEPIFEKEFADSSYGFRPGRSAKDALREVDKLLKDGQHYVIDADISKYFDTIPQDKLMERVKERIADSQVIKLIESFLKQNVMEGMERWTPEKGTPQGGVISPLLANIYLNPLDHLMAKEGYKMVRYADDFVVMCESQDKAQEALSIIREWMTEARLELHPEKTKIVNMQEKGASFEFLGYKFEHNQKGKQKRWPRKKSMKRFKDTIRLITKRTSGLSMETIIAKLNLVIRGWYQYYRHSSSYTFKALDGWIRMRLRSILRKRNKKKGRGRGLDHQRWPNNYFKALGLFFTVEANNADRQSAR